MMVVNIWHNGKYFDFGFFFRRNLDFSLPKYELLGKSQRYSRNINNLQRSADDKQIFFGKLMSEIYCM